jgi:uncharacterized membrane protein
LKKHFFGGIIYTVSSKTSSLKTKLRRINMKKSGRTTLFLCRGALVAAIYVVLTWLVHTVGLDSGPVQVRISEMLCVLPFFMPEAVAGITVGCLIANLSVSASIWDIIFGTLATLVGALGTRAFLRCKGWVRYLCVLPTIISNTVIIPLVLRYAYGEPQLLYVLAMGVFFGEAISAGVLGVIFMRILEKRKIFSSERKRRSV